MGDRAVYCARLESVCAAKHPGFESLPIRHFVTRSLAFLLVGLLVACGKSGSQRSDSALEQAKREFHEAKFDSALSLLAKNDKPAPEALDLRGCVLMEQGKFEEAAQAFDEAHQANPALFAPRLHHGDLFLRQFKFTDARREYQMLLDETNILISHERLRYVLLITYLAEQNDNDAKRMLDSITFPTESAAYYFAQAAWAYAHKDQKSGDEWTAKARRVYDSAASSWFARPLFDLGWIKKKPPLAYSLANS